VRRRRRLVPQRLRLGERQVLRRGAVQQGSRA
jgi:hypothetical protein